MIHHQMCCMGLLRRPPLRGRESPRSSTNVREGPKHVHSGDTERRAARNQPLPKGPSQRCHPRPPCAKKFRNELPAGRNPTILTEFGVSQVCGSNTRGSFRVASAHLPPRPRKLCAASTGRARGCRGRGPRVRAAARSSATRFSTATMTAPPPAPEAPCLG